MKLKIFLLLVFSMCARPVFAQTDVADILEVVLRKYYKEEKVIVKGRQQILSLYCDKVNNNEEIFEAVQGLKLPPPELKSIRRQVNEDTQPATWQTELEAIYAKDQTKLQQKINDCLTVDQYHERRARLNLNNMRMMILSKPIFYENGKKALMKVTFYRALEHNSGSVLLMEKTASGWIIKDYLNAWST